MDSIKLSSFFNMDYENKQNKLIVEDPSKADIQGIIAYIGDLCSIPYSDFIQYLKDNPTHHSYCSADITQSSKPENSHRGLCQAFMRANYRGLSTADLADYLFNDDVERSVNTRQRYGRDQATTAKQLGLTKLNIGKWHVSCLGLVFLSLDEETQIAIMGRALLRDAFYSKLLVYASEQEAILDEWMLDLNRSTVKRRISCVRYLCSIAEKASDNLFKGFKMPDKI